MFFSFGCFGLFEQSGGVWFGFLVGTFFGWFFVWLVGVFLFFCFNICGTMHEKSARKHAWIEMTRQTKILKMDAHLTTDIGGEKTLKYI